MDKAVQYLISKDNGNLQIPYEEYLSLMEKAEEAKRIDAVKNEVITNLKAFLGGRSGAVEAEPSSDQKAGAAVDAVENVKAEELKDAPEILQANTVPRAEPAESVEPAPAAEQAPVAEPAAPEKPLNANARPKAADLEIPPIKKEIEEHFNKLDESGRLLNVFRQYYTCLNDSCGSTVRVTMKDGFCSLWNYDEWEEFAFVDIFEGTLRFSVDPRYTDALAALSMCEVPRLLSSRLKLVSAQMDDLNATMLDVLARAFEEVGTTAS